MKRIRTLSTLLLLIAILQIGSSQTDFMRINSKAVIDFVVTDPLGRKTGYDALTDAEIAQIPKASYGIDGISDLDDSTGFHGEWATFSIRTPVNGVYTVRAVGVESGDYNLASTGLRSGNKFSSSVAGQATLGRVSYYQMEYNNNPSVPITLARVLTTNQVSGGIFNVGGGTLSVKAKPSVNFTSNALNTLVATVRWFTAYGITLSNPSSPTYGFAKWDSVIVSGSYSYQKFRAVGSVPINWEADTEYELFTTDVSGGTGTGTFELTNAVPGGEWFVDVNYSDKSDTLFYNPIASETPLPIELWYFTATVITGPHVRLDWGTLTETNNYGFEVQESQSPTSGFTSISGSFTPGHGTTLEPHEYSYTDLNTSPGIWYYRLKQIDLDGALHYTDAEQVSIPSGQTQVANFTGIVLTDNSVRLDWETLTEANNSGFEVQESRSGPSGFTTIAGSFTPGHGTTTQHYYYSYIDHATGSGLWYYRLKQIDLDGTPHYLNPVGVTVPNVQIDVENFSASSLPQLGVQLEWATRGETNNLRFWVQVSRGDSLHFRPIPNGVVPGHGTTTTRQTYSFRDRRPAADVWFFRLKQYNRDGRVRYTSHIRVNVP